MNNQSDIMAEVRLVASVLEKLVQASPSGSVRKDQLDPLIRRLREVATKNCTAAESLGGPTGSDATGVKGYVSAAGDGDAAARPVAIPRADSAHLRNASATRATSEGMRNNGRNKKDSTRKKMSSVRVVPIARETPPLNGVVVAKDVARVFTCSLYNLLESSTRLLSAASASIFVRKADEMVAIVNVASKLAFPPELKRSRCQESLDAEVLGSGIALNQRIHDPTLQSGSVLIFPVYPGGSPRRRGEGAVATIHVENKSGGNGYFDSLDESLLFFVACLAGDLLSRAPNIWHESFYDPSTQHVVAPFVPSSSGLPLLQTLASKSTRDGASRSSAIGDPKFAAKVDEFTEDVLVKRELVPHKATKPMVSGLSVAPSLREVRSYIENVQDCWKRNVVSNVDLMEDDRESQMEVKSLRLELTRTRKKLLDCEEQLRLYELHGSDYKEEYKDMRKELDGYLRRRDHLL